MLVDPYPCASCKNSFSEEIEWVEPIEDGARRIFGVACNDWYCCSEECAVCWISENANLVRKYEIEKQEQRYRNFKKA